MDNYGYDEELWSPGGDDESTSEMQDDDNDDDDESMSELQDDEDDAVFAYVDDEGYQFTRREDDEKQNITSIPAFTLEDYETLTTDCDRVAAPRLNARLRTEHDEYRRIYREFTGNDAGALAFFKRNIKQKRYLDTGTASRAIFMVGSMRLAETVIPVLMKAGYDDTKDNSLLAERFIYKYVVNQLFDNRCTPHLSPALMLFSAPRAALNERGIPDDASVHRREAFIGSTGASLERSHVMVAPRGGVSLEDNTELMYEWEDLSIVLLQILHTLLCFRDVGLMHHDLHLGNILVEYSDVPRTSKYVLNVYDRIVEVTSHFECKIIDFDMAAKVNTLYSECAVENKRLVLQSERGRSFCTHGRGACNKYVRTFDWISLLGFIAEEVGTAHDKHLSMFVNMDLLRTITPENGYYPPYPCRAPDRNSMCQVIPPEHFQCIDEEDAIFVLAREIVRAHDGEEGFGMHELGDTLRSYCDDESLYMRPLMLHNVRPCD